MVGGSDCLINKYMVGVVWVQFFGGWGAHACIIFVLHEFIWNAPTVSLVLPAIDDTGSLGSLPQQMVYFPGSMVLPWLIASHFLAGIKETELKPTTFLLSWSPSDMVPLSAAYWDDSSLIIIIKYIYIYLFILFIKLLPSPAIAGSARIMPRNELQ